MSGDPRSGQAPFEFVLRQDLTHLPPAAQEFEVKLHGGFAIDPRPEGGHIFYGMPGCGIMRIEPDLSRQDIIKLPDELKPLNFHSTKIGQFDGKWRLFMPAEGDQKVAVLTTDGQVEFVLSRPEFEQYKDPEVPYYPTDTVLVDKDLYVADGYGSNYISVADVGTQKWKSIFGGKTEDKTEDGKFGTAHGINLNPHHHHLDIADRPHSRIQNHGLDGKFISSKGVPPGSLPCGIAYLAQGDDLFAVVGCLEDPDKNRAAPIYILNAKTYELLSTIRPKEELGVELADHLHNVVLHVHDRKVFLVCQAWNPGHYFVLERR